MGAIDLNSDLGEGAGSDEAIMPLISSANICCGAHAGDERTTRATIALAKRHGVAVGAHPGYADKENFGRVALDLPRERLVASIREQIELVRDLARAEGTALAHVKAHGALYNRAEREAAAAEAIVEAVVAVDASLVIFAMPGSAIEAAALAAGLHVAREGFADRAYEADGALRSRRLPGALHTDPAVAAAQALSVVRQGRVRAVDGTFLTLTVDTLCVHGDTPGAAAIASAVGGALRDAGVVVRPFAR